MRHDLSRIFHLRRGALEKKPEGFGRSELIPPQSNVDTSAVKLGERNEREREIKEEKGERKRKRKKYEDKKENRKKRKRTPTTRAFLRVWINVKQRVIIACIFFFFY